MLDHFRDDLAFHWKRPLDLPLGHGQHRRRMKEGSELSVTHRQIQHRDLSLTGKGVRRHFGKHFPELSLPGTLPSHIFFA